MPAIAPASPPAPRLVAAMCRGQRIAVECPLWCVRDHSREDLAFLEDLSHEGEEIALPAPEFSGVSAVLISSIREWPFVKDEEKGLPYLGFDATGFGDVAALAPAAALAFIDQAAAHLEKMRAQARQLAEVQRDAVQPTED
ncbi:hypothetical protein [Streptomyces sp. MK37H]|uniref:DUF6907 domain-containing protein n=1 Tax=Streptomyces sp. MK37H TaxID=2699117 RepID=UPI001B39092D|nr:hypothetical protein [Streptomyces sp. MK37H]